MNATRLYRVAHATSGHGCQRPSRVVLIALRASGRPVAALVVRRRQLTGEIAEQPGFCQGRIALIGPHRVA